MCEYSRWRWKLGKWVREYYYRRANNFKLSIKMLAVTGSLVASWPGCFDYPPHLCSWPGGSSFFSFSISPYLLLCLYLLSPPSPSLIAPTYSMHSVRQDSSAVSVTTPKLSSFLPLQIAVYQSPQPEQGPPSQAFGWTKILSVCFVFAIRTEYQNAKSW